MHKLATLYLSWFGSGYSPKAPGTVGTLAALPFIYLWSLLAPPAWLNISLIVVMTLAACLVAEKIQKETQTHDPQWIVVDEVIGMLITWAIVEPRNIIEWISCFIAFRAFDIIKIWPASYFDKEVLHGAGTILDDVVSALYAGSLVLIICLYFLR
jgi:phosphatidylglycerophosphatase A